MKYTTKKIELTNDHYLAVTDLAEYTHEIFSDFKNSHFSKKYKNQPFPGQYLLFIAGGLAESYNGKMLQCQTAHLAPSFQHYL